MRINLSSKPIRTLAPCRNGIASKLQRVILLEPIHQRKRVPARKTIFASELPSFFIEGQWPRLAAYDYLVPRLSMGRVLSNVIDVFILLLDDRIHVIG